jgi:hypothetical protein
MFALDLFNNDHERRLAEGAVDKLEQRRIDDLAMKMDDLVARAKQAKDPAAKAALMKEFQKCRTERDNYFKIKDECMGYGTLVGETEEDEEEWYDANGRPSEYGCYDAGGHYHPDREQDMDAGYDAYKERQWTDESGGIGQDLVTPQQRVQQSTPQKQTPVGKVVDTARQAAKWVAGKGGPGKEGPTYESELDEAFGPLGSKGLMNGNLATFMKARQAKTPVTLEIGNEQFRLTPTMMDAMAKKYNDDKVASEADPTNKDKKLIAINNYRAFGYPQLMRAFIDGIATPEPTAPANVPGEQLPMFEKTSSQKKKFNDPEVSNELRKLRAKYPSANSDVEALTKQELETDKKQDLAIANLDAENKELFQKLNSIITTKTAPAVKSVVEPGAVTTPAMPAIPPVTPTTATAPTKVATPAIPSTTPIIGPTPASTTTASTATEKLPVSKKPEKTKEPTAKKSKTVKYRPAKTKIQRPTTPALSDPNTIDVDAWEVPTIDIPDELDNIAGGPPAEPSNVAANDSQRITQRQAAEGIEKPTAIGQMVKNTGQGTELQNDPAYRRDVRRTQQQVAQRQQNIARQQTGYGDDTEEFGDIPDINESNMSELDIMVQDLNPHHMSDRQFLKAYGISKVAFQQKYRTLLKPTHQQDVPHTLHEGERLHKGDPIVVTAPNEFEGKTGEIYEFSPSGSFVIVDLYNHGKHSMHLSDVAYNDYADQEETDDWYDDEEVAEGFQDFNKIEPYAVCLAGKPVKQFDYYEDARRFHDNWKKKLYRAGNKEKADKITLMPLNLDEGHADQQRKIFKKNGESVGEVGIDRESSPGNGQWYMKCYAYNIDNAGYDSYEDAVAELKHCLKQGVAEAANPAQQAAIAIAMKKAGKKPKQADEAYTPSPAKPFRNPKGFNKQGTGIGNRLAQQTRAELANIQPSKGTPVPAKEFAQGVLKDLKKVNVKEAEGSWIVYDPETKQIKKRFKTHTAGKSYAQTHGLGFASSEYYFDQIKEKEVAEVAPPGAKAERMVKHIKKAYAKDGKLTPKEKAIAYATTWKAHNDGKVEEAQTDYQKRRQRERDVDAGRPVKALPKNPQTDYARKRAKDKRDMEMGEGLTTEPTNRKEYLDQRDKLFRMLAVETNPANKQIIKTAIKNLDARYGSTKDPIREESSTSSEAVEIALIRRVLVAHTDLIMNFGLDKVTQAIEEIAYNVGDVDEIGTSDVSGWMHQVQQILGVE